MSETDTSTSSLIYVQPPTTSLPEYFGRPTAVILALAATWLIVSNAPQVGAHAAFNLGVACALSSVIATCTVTILRELRARAALDAGARTYIHKRLKAMERLERATHAGVSGVLNIAEDDLRPYRRGRR